MNATIQTEETLVEEGPHWVSRAAFPVVVSFFALNELLIMAAVYYHHYWLAALLVLTASHFMHGQLIGFHEASHGSLRHNRTLNEIDGLIIGSFSFISFSLFRAVHQSHHAHLGTERDEELWPFVKISIPRWRRQVAAFLELNLGIFFTPFLFFRSFLREGSPIRNKKLRRRIWIELGMMAAFWTVLLGTVAFFGLWSYLLWMFVLPAVLAANLQSWRKYIEHMGLNGSTVNGLTRSIVSKGIMGEVVSFTLLHEPYHGVHHRHSGLPHAELPGRAEILQPKLPEENPVFSSYRHALTHLLHKLIDPQIGAQWLKASAPGSARS